MKSTGPGSLLYYICLRDLFLFAFIFRYINPKTQKYLAAFFVIYFISRSREIYLSNLLQFYLYYYPGGIDLFYVGLQVFILCVQVPFT